MVKINVPCNCELRINHADVLCWICVPSSTAVAVMRGFYKLNSHNEKYSSILLFLVTTCNVVLFVDRDLLKISWNARCGNGGIDANFAGRIGIVCFLYYGLFHALPKRLVVSARVQHTGLCTETCFIGSHYRTSCLCSKLLQFTSACRPAPCYFRYIATPCWRGDTHFGK